MKSIGIREAKNSLASVVNDAQESEVVITQHGEPAVLVIGLRGLDMEQVALGLDDELWQLIERRRAKGRVVSTEHVRRRLGL